MQLGDAGHEPQVAVAAAIAIGRGDRIQGGPVHLDAVGERFEHRLVVNAFRLHRIAP